VSQDTKTETDVVTTQKQNFALPAAKADVQDVFRLLFASDNSLIELFERGVIVALSDLIDLNRKCLFVLNCGSLIPLFILSLYLCPFLPLC